MSFRRIPREIDPRRPPKQRERSSDAEPRPYGQLVDLTTEEIAELERTTGEVAREGSGAVAEGARDLAAAAERRKRDAREKFEDATDEVSRENNESR